MTKQTVSKLNDDMIPPSTMKKAMLFISDYNMTPIQGKYAALRIDHPGMSKTDAYQKASGKYIEFGQDKKIRAMCSAGAGALERHPKVSALIGDMSDDAYEKLTTPVEMDLESISKNALIEEQLSIYQLSKIAGKFGDCNKALENIAKLKGYLNEEAAVQINVPQITLSPVTTMTIEQ